MLSKLKQGAMAGICTVIFSLAVASLCHGEEAVHAVWTPKPQAQPVEVTASSEARQQNGCPASSGLDPKQWVCLTLPEARKVDERLIDLESLLIAERSKRPRRLGLSVACTVGASVSSDGSYGLVPPSCGIYYGFAIPLGR